MFHTKHHLILTTFLTIPLIFNFANWQKAEPDPFLHHQVQAFSAYQADNNSYDSLSAEPSFNQQFHFNHLNRGDVLDHYRGEGVVVAIIDSGLNTAHLDFFDGTSTNVLDTSAYIEETGSYYSNIDIQTVAEFGRSIIEDPLDNGHGTNVAGTIGAMVNQVGTAGVSPNVNLMILKTNYYFTEIDAAIRYAADEGADIINMSIGAYAESFYDGYGDFQEGIDGADTYFQSSLTYAYNKGVTLVAAAGNEKTDKKSYPAANTHVIGVGALARNSSTTIASYSNYGLDNVDLVAPGSVYVSDIGHTNAYTETQGTSFAAPIVASAAALYKQKYPQATPLQITQKLQDSAYDLAPTGRDETFGYGRLDITRLMSDVAVTGVELSPSSLSLRVGDTTQLTATVLPSNATNKNVIFVLNDDDIVTVDDEGWVNAIAIGTTSIAVLTDDGMYDDETSITVTSVSEPLNLNEITIVDRPLVLAIGASHSLRLALDPSNATVNDVDFSSTQPSVATINDQGMIQALSRGTTTIHATAKLGGAGDTLTVTVSQFVEQAITYTFTNKSWGASPQNWQSQEDGNGYLNAGVQVSASTSGANAISPQSFTNIQSVVIGYATNSSKGAGTIQVYVLDHPSNVASRELIGTFSPTTTGGTTKRDTSLFIPSTIQSGYLQIEVTCTTNSIYICDIDIMYQQEVAAPIPVTGVSLSAPSLELVTQQTVQLDYAVLPSNATNTTLIFTSSNEDVATVSSSGLVAAHQVGTTIIRATSIDGGHYDEITLSVTQPIVYEPQLTLNTSQFKTVYTFKEALDTAHLTAQYRDSGGFVTDLSGEDLTLTSGTTSRLGPSILTFSYLDVSEQISISVTNVGAEAGSGEMINERLTLNYDGFDPVLTSTETDYSSIAIGDIVFNGANLRYSNSNFFIGDGGFIANTTALGNIVSIRFDYASEGSASSWQAIRFASTPLTSASGSAYQTISSSSGGSSTVVTAPEGVSYFRLDITNKNLQALITIDYQSGQQLNFTASEQAQAYYDYFMALTHEECLVNDVTLSTWDVLKSEYDAMLDESKDIIQTSQYSGLVARYQIIVNAYGYYDYLASGVASALNTRGSHSQPWYIITLTAFAFGGAYYFYRGKAKHKR